NKAFWVLSLLRIPMSFPAPQGGSGTAGVFLVSEGGMYTFNYTAAREACERLNVTMATREQVERALQDGLQTCKFGWIAEQIAVVPRLTSDEKCGQGRIGVVTWNAHLDRKFAVFCYNASERNETNTSPSTTLTPPTQTPIPVTPSVAPTHTPPPEQKLPTFTTRGSRTSSTTPPSPPTRHGGTTKPAPVSLTFSTSVSSPGALGSSEPDLTRSVVTSTESSLGGKI
uniref:Link domain-containing protein n=1 Tax=Salarias fasciatus TaxID=181472 RepID=A0A672JBW4_SALFA